MNPHFQGLCQHVNVLLSALKISTADHSLLDCMICPLARKAPIRGANCGRGQTLSDAPVLSPFVHVFRQDFSRLLERLETDAVSAADVATELREMERRLFKSVPGSADMGEGASEVAGENDVAFAEGNSEEHGPKRAEIVAALKVLGVSAGIAVGHLAPVSDDDLPVELTRLLSVLRSLGAPPEVEVPLRAAWEACPGVGGESKSVRFLHEVLAALNMDFPPSAHGGSGPISGLGRWMRGLADVVRGPKQASIAEPFLRETHEDVDDTAASPIETMDAEELRCAGRHDPSRCIICSTTFCDDRCVPVPQ